MIMFSDELPDCWNKTIVIDESNSSQSMLLFFNNKIPQHGSLIVQLLGRGCRVKITLLYLGYKSYDSTINVTINHEAPETYGRIIMKAALFDQSRLTFRGMLDIKEQAKGADSYLLAKALVLSPYARAEIYPYLEIKTDEVKASHGSSIGALDERSLFYLASRGVTKEKAQHILLAEFFRDVARDLPKEYQKKLFQYV